MVGSVGPTFAYLNPHSTWQRPWPIEVWIRVIHGHAQAVPSAHESEALGILWPPALAASHEVVVRAQLLRDVASPGRSVQLCGLGLPNGRFR